MSTVVGIDPGLTGAFAMIRDGELVALVDMPIEQVGGKNRIDPHEVASILVQLGPVDLVVVEFVNAVFGSAAGTSFSFGHGAGILHGVLSAYERPWQQVKPPAWTAALGLTGTGKNMHRAAAMNLFPSEAGQFARVMDDGRADAALIAEYGVRMLAGGSC